MTVPDKLNSIANWYSRKQKEPVRRLNKTGRSPAIGKLEQLTGLLLPDWYKKLYATYDGEIGTGLGSFIGDSFLSMDEVVKSAEYAASLIKPAERKVENPVLSGRAINEILAMVRLSIPEGTPWHKIEFDASVGSMGGPYLYKTSTTDKTNREYFELEWSVQKKIMDATKELHELEQKSYNWDKLSFTTYADTFDLERIDHDLTSQLSSYPKNAIRLKYFHLKWIPVFGDHGGNYIGIDLDPDTAGKLGQVIIFGRDEDQMIIVADSFEKFLDLTLDTIKKNEKVFLGYDHLHSVYRSTIK
jgi:cell wall assembly regulator SMI1